jgi:hypothetical protein
MSAQFKIVKGSSDYYPLQTWNRGSMSAPAYASSDTFVGEDQPGARPGQPLLADDHMVHRGGHADRL